MKILKKVKRLKRFPGFAQVSTGNLVCDTMGGGVGGSASLRLAAEEIYIEDFLGE